MTTRQRRLRRFGWTILQWASGLLAAAVIFVLVSAEWSTPRAARAFRWLAHRTHRFLRWLAHHSHRILEHLVEDTSRMADNCQHRALAFRPPRSRPKADPFANPRPREEAQRRTDNHASAR
ncbi:hypothetical protein [Embleya sp. NBC_00896]|uniref:hypothetical protein n=1 Tax=Embleya sp. NBC_00896 TaxID=2975961 RepID=UPI002F917080|nr:hypothetical protein OG928_48105 [Embleya sp. NBC_00896]